jgi:secernin
MCDTLVALGNSTEDGCTIFGKNSDRPQDEVQLITYVPPHSYANGDEVKCTYISIPQVNETLAMYLSQPWWMWGAEMGVNQQGVVIGNEAIYTNEPLRKKGLLGMDLLRLGLERGKTAKKALTVIAELLEKYHQGGGCAYRDPGWAYHNSFIVGDSEEAYVLETADDWWIAEKVEDVRSISNGVSIRGKGDLRREGIIQYAIERGYCKDDSEFDFAVTFSGSPPSTSPFSRAGKSALLLEENKSKITPELMMEFLREHQAGICMHGGFESTGSQVSHLRNDKHSIHWFTGTTLPCVSTYKPYIFPAEGQKYYPPGPYSKKDPNWSWVNHTVNKSRKIVPKLMDIENKIITQVNDLISSEEKISNTEFVNKVKVLNNEIWDKSEKLL